MEYEYGYTQKLKSSGSRVVGIIDSALSSSRSLILSAHELIMKRNVGQGT